MNPFERFLFSMLDKYFDARETAKLWNSRFCSYCLSPYAHEDANYCYHCGRELKGYWETEPTIKVPAVRRQTGALLMEYLENKKR